MTTFYLRTSNNRIPIVKALETILMDDDEITEVEEINILDDLTKEDYERAFKISMNQPQHSSLMKYL
jgi:hypothetical protein